MRAGQSRYDITVQQKTVMRDPVYNEEQVTWTTFLQCCACMEEKRGREFFIDKQRFPETLTIFEIRFEDGEGITPAMRIVMDEEPDRVYAIKAVRRDMTTRRAVFIDTTTGTGIS